MVSTHYLSPGPHHTDRVQADSLCDSTSCSSGASTGAYTTPELDPYSAVSGVSSFNYPAAADPTLLTPVSSAGSPPLQPRQAAKPMRGYHQSQSSAAGAQIPTPPNTSKMYYGQGPYDINTSSQGSSPMTVHPVSEAPAFDMASYMAHSPPGSHHPSSPKVDVPPPIDPYLGHFTVSGGNEPEVSHHPFHSYQYPNVQLDPELFVPRQQQQQPTHVPVSAPSHMHHHLPPSGPPSTLTRPHQSAYSHEPSPRIEDLRGDPSMLIPHYTSHHRPTHRSSGGIRKKVPPVRKPSRTPKGTPQVGSIDGQGGFGDDEDQEELTLRDDAPEDDKYLFQLRKEFISEKGKGMWEEMKAKYSEKHQGNWEKAALQMKVSRAVAKFGVWPKREIERLREAHQYYEEKRYQLILARMKENGGCRVWDWKPQHIEAMLVKLGVEEPTLDDKSGTRRRKHKAARRRASQGHQHIQRAMGDWSNGLGLHQTFQGHPQHLAARHTPFEIMDEASIAPAFTSEQENEYLDQIFNKQIKAESSLSPEVVDMSYDDGSNRAQPRDLNNHHSERVARQACEQMMQQQTRVQEHVYAAQ